MVHIYTLGTRLQGFPLGYSTSAHLERTSPFSESEIPTEGERVDDRVEMMGHLHFDFTVVVSVETINELETVMSEH